MTDHEPNTLWPHLRHDLMDATFTEGALGSLIHFYRFEGLSADAILEACEQYTLKVKNRNQRRERGHAIRIDLATMHAIVKISNIKPTEE